MITPAKINDLSEILEIEKSIVGHKNRETKIRKFIESDQCIISKEDGKTVGYLIFSNNFFDSNFIELLMVNPVFHNKGIGSSLIRYYENTISNEKIFTSTNLSNQKMINLLKKLKFVDSGIIFNLDDNDPELVFVKNNGNRTVGPSFIST